MKLSLPQAIKAYIICVSLFFISCFIYASLPSKSNIQDIELKLEKVPGDQVDFDATQSGRDNREFEHASEFETDYTGDNSEDGYEDEDATEDTGTAEVPENDDTDSTGQVDEEPNGPTQDDDEKNSDAEPTGEADDNPNEDENAGSTGQDDEEPTGPSEDDEKNSDAESNGEADNNPNEDEDADSTGQADEEPTGPTEDDDSNDSDADSDVESNGEAIDNPNEEEDVNFTGTPIEEPESDDDTAENHDVDLTVLVPTERIVVNPIENVGPNGTGSITQMLNILNGIFDSNEIIFNINGTDPNEDSDEGSVNFENNAIFTVDVMSETEDGEVLIGSGLNTVEIPISASVVPSNSDLFELIETDQFEQFNSAIQNLNNINEIWNERGCNLLHRAAEKHSVRFMTAIIAKAPSGFVNERTRDEYEWNVMHLVVLNSKRKTTEEISQIISVLIQNGADINAISGSFNDAAPYTPLYLAIIHKNLKAIEALLINGADPNSEYEGLPLLHHSFSQCPIEGVDLMLKYLADPTKYNKHNRAALHEAAVLDNADIANLLIDKYNCDINIRTPKKHDAKKKSKKELRAAPILYDATPFHYAFKENNYNVALLLAKKGASYKIKDSYGKTPDFYDDMYLRSIIFNTNKI